MKLLPYYYHLLSLSFWLLAMTTGTAASATATTSERSKYAVRLVYSESFPEFCTPEDSTALFHLVSETLRGGHAQTKSNNSSGKKQRRLLRTIDPMDCSAECAWVNAGQCTVVKPWLAGPCNDWKSNRQRRLESMTTTFDSFLDFSQQVTNEQRMVPTIGKDTVCTEAIRAVRMALQHHSTFSTMCAQKVFGKPVEVECFRGYL